MIARRPNRDAKQLELKKLTLRQLASDKLDEVHGGQHSAPVTTTNCVGH